MIAANYCKASTAPPFSNVHIFRLSSRSSFRESSQLLVVIASAFVGLVQGLLENFVRDLSGLNKSAKHGPPCLSSGTQMTYSIPHRGRRRYAPRQGSR